MRPAWRQRNSEERTARAKRGRRPDRARDRARALSKRAAGAGNRPEPGPRARPADGPANRPTSVWANDEAVYCIRAVGGAYPQPHVGASAAGRDSATAATPATARRRANDRDGPRAPVGRRPTRTTEEPRRVRARRPRRWANPIAAQQSARAHRNAHADRVGGVAAQRRPAASRETPPKHLDEASQRERADERERRGRGGGTIPAPPVRP